MTYEELLTAFTRMALVVVGAPALAFAILGGLASAARSRHHSAESGLWFGARLGLRVVPYVAVPYGVLAFWAAYPRMVLLFVVLWGFGDGAFHPERALRRRYRRDVRWLRRETEPTARRAEEAVRRRVDASRERAKGAARAAPRHAWRGLRAAGRRARRTAETDPPSAAGWLFGRHRDDESPGNRARRDRIEERIAARLMEGDEPPERPTVEQRIARWADRLGFHTGEEPIMTNPERPSAAERLGRILGRTAPDTRRPTPPTRPPVVDEEALMEDDEE